jgi:hypothetical protein
MGSSHFSTMIFVMSGTQGTLSGFIHRGKPSSRQAFITASLHHCKPSSLQAFITASLHRCKPVLLHGRSYGSGIV